MKSCHYPEKVLYLRIRVRVRIRINVSVTVEVRTRISGNTFNYVFGQTSIRARVLDPLTNSPATAVPKKFNAAINPTNAKHVSCSEMHILHFNIF